MDQLARHLSLLVVAFLAFGCSAPADQSRPDRSDKSDGPAACAADEALLACLTEQCADLVGNDFDECFTENCEEGHDDTPLDCGLCVVNGFEAGEDAAGIVTICTGTIEAESACASDESILVCLSESCPGLVGPEFDVCFEENCETQIEDDNTPMDCALCVVNGFEAGLDSNGISSECTGAGATDGSLTGVACANSDLELFDCLSDNCPDADTSDAVGECIASSCSAQVEQVAMSCLICVDGQLSQADADASLEESCSAAESAPCDVQRAAAMQQCSLDKCPGSQGDALNECMDLECPEVFEDLSEQCGQCIIALNQNGVPFSDAAGSCAGH